MVRRASVCLLLVAAICSVSLAADRKPIGRWHNDSYKREFGLAIEMYDEGGKTIVAIGYKGFSIPMIQEVKEVPSMGGRRFNRIDKHPEDYFVIEKETGWLQMGDKDGVYKRHEPWVEPERVDIGKWQHGFYKGPKKVPIVIYKENGKAYASTTLVENKPSILLVEETQTPDGKRFVEKNTGVYYLIVSKTGELEIGDELGPWCKCAPLKD